MKKALAILTLMIISMAILLPFTIGTKAVSAQNASYTIPQIDHQVEIMYSGHVVIRDTIHVNGQITDGFLIGFPYVFGAYVLKAVAYDANNVFPINLGVQLENRSGFYGAEISFPQGAPQVFTVVFVLSNSLLNQYLNFSGVAFPAYPSLTKEAAYCNVTLVLPDFAADVTVTKDDGVVTTTNFTKTNLAAFTYSPASVSFSMPPGILQKVGIKNIDRVITVDPAGDVVASDTYRIVNNSTDSLGSFNVDLPLDAEKIVGNDEFGRNLTVELLGTGSNFQLFNVTFITPLTISGSALFTVEYALPRVSPEQSTHFALNFDLFPYFDYYVEEASATIIPPEGARFLTPQIGSLDLSSSLNRGTFQETLSINRVGVSYIDQAVPSEDVLRISYEYNPLWLSFRPTVWMWTIAVVGCAIIVVWRRPKTSVPPRIVAPKASVGLSPDHIRAFIETYEEKNRLSSELKALDARAQKGKIPRRQYKVQRRTLEVRFDALSKNIAGVKETFRRAGGIYSNLTRQLTVAETELVEVETNIATIEARQSRGELSLEVFKKQFGDYQRRKEKAETTINGILLRLREEIH